MWPTTSSCWAASRPALALRREHARAGALLHDGAWRGGRACDDHGACGCAEHAQRGQRRAGDDQVVRHQLPLPGARVHRPHHSSTWPASACLPRWPRPRRWAIRVKAVLLGPLSFLWLGKIQGARALTACRLLDSCCPCTAAVLARLKAQGVEWVQIDEPILGLDLPGGWRHALRAALLAAGHVGAPKLLLATYFSPLEENLSLACQLPVAGLHVDAVRAPQELVSVCRLAAAAQGAVGGRRRRPQHLAHRPGRGPGRAAPRWPSGARASCGWRRRARCCMCRSAWPARRTLDAEVRSWLAVRHWKSSTSCACSEAAP